MKINNPFMQTLMGYKNTRANKLFVIVDLSMIFGYSIVNKIAAAAREIF